MGRRSNSTGRNEKGARPQFTGFQEWSEEIRWKIWSIPHVNQNFTKFEKENDPIK
jgi:hypothetical protein